MNPEEEFRSRYDDLYRLVKPFIASVPDYRPEKAVVRFTGSYTYGSEIAKWGALLHELDSISARELQGETEDGNVLARAQDERYYVYINYPTTVRHFIQEYPTLSWILTVLKHEWRLLLVGSGVMDLLEEVKPKVTAVQTKAYFSEARNVDTVNRLLTLYSESREAKKLKEDAIAVKKNGKLLINAQSRGRIAAYTVMQSARKEDGNVHIYTDSSLPIRKIDVELGLLSKDRYYEDLTMLLMIAHDIPVMSHDYDFYFASVYWNFIINKMLSYKHEIPLSLWNTRLALAAHEQGLKVASDELSSQFAKAIVDDDTNRIVALLQSVEYLRAIDQQLPLSHIMYIASPAMRDTIINEIVRSGLINDVSSFDWIALASDGLLRSLIPYLLGTHARFEEVSQFHHKYNAAWSSILVLEEGEESPTSPRYEEVSRLLHTLLRRGRGDVLIAAADELDDQTLLHAVSSIYDFEAITRFFVERKRLDLIYTPALRDLFTSTTDVYTLTTLIDISRSMGEKAFIGVKEIKPTFDTAKAKHRDDICDYLRQALLNV